MTSSLDIPVSKENLLQEMLRIQACLNDSYDFEPNSITFLNIKNAVHEYIELLPEDEEKPPQLLELFDPYYDFDRLFSFLNYFSSIKHLDNYYSKLAINSLLFALAPLQPQIENGDFIFKYDSSQFHVITFQDLCELTERIIQLLKPTKEEIND